MRGIKTKIKIAEISVIAYAIIQLLFFVNFAAAAEESDWNSSEIDFEKLAPSINIDSSSLKDSFDQKVIAEKNRLSGFKGNVFYSNEGAYRLFNVQFVNDLALNPGIMASIDETEFKQAMLSVLGSDARELRIAYLKAMDSFVRLDENNSLDIQIMGEIANLIIKDRQEMEARLRAIKALGTIGTRQPQFRDYMELLIVDCVNERVELAKKRGTPYLFLVFQARESLLEMGSDIAVTQNIESMGVSIPEAVDYTRSMLLKMINYINQDQKKNNKKGRVYRIYSKQNSFTDGLWLFGSDIDGLVIELENISREDMSRYERLFANLFTEVGIAGAKADAVERPFWTTSSTENILKRLAPTEITLYDLGVYDDSGSDRSLWSPLKAGWSSKESDFRTEKSKLRKLFIDLIDPNKDAEAVLDGFLVNDEAILSAAEKKRIKDVFNDPIKADKIRKLLRRMHFIMGTGEVFYESHAQNEMFVEDLFETIEFLKIIEKIADDSGDQLIKLQEIITWNDSKEFHVYPLWFMYTAGAVRNTDEGIKIVGRNGNRLIVNDDNIFIRPVDEDGVLLDNRAASLADIIAFSGLNKAAVYNVQDRTITFVGLDSFAYNMAGSDANLRLVFFDANGDITFLANDQTEAEDFKQLIAESNIFGNILNKDRMLLVKDMETRIDLTEPQGFSGFLKRNNADSDQSIMIIMSGEDTAVVASQQQLSDFIGSAKQVIFDTVSKNIVLVEDIWTVNQRIEQNPDYRYFFFDGNGDITLFVENSQEAEMFESVISGSNMLSQALNVTKKLIFRDINTSEDLMAPIELFELIGKNVLANGKQVDRITVGQVVNSGPDRLYSIGAEAIIANEYQVDQAI